MPPSPVSRTQAEQIISASRVALAGASIFAVWLDPGEPANHVQLTFALHGAYLLYAGVLLILTWTSRISPRLATWSHIVDITTFSVFQYLTLAPASPFFIYFVFSMYCGALRWGWKGTLATSAVVLTVYLGLLSISHLLTAAPFDVNRIIIRVVNLLMVATMLIYLGRYQERLRHEIERLARWPSATGTSEEQVTQATIEHAAQIVNAGRATIVWEAHEEPRVHVGTWSAGRLVLLEHPPGELAALLPEPLAKRILMVVDDVAPGAPVLIVDEDGVVIEQAHEPLPASIFAHVSGHGLISAPFSTERLTGRAYFTDLGTRNAEMAALTAVVARDIGTWLDQLHLARQRREISAREERLRLARDLHDGVLQSLTGIRFEMRAVAHALRDTDETTQARLLALERALSIEQRELRFFIGGLQPEQPALAPAASLAGRLDALRERIALEWATPVAIRISPESQDCPAALVQAIPLMVHEAVVNALKHAQPTRVNVNVDSASDRLRIVVSDDGHGFPFKGHYDHRALNQSQTAPRSLFDRVTALGGKMSIESSETGSRVEMVVSL